MSELNFAFNAFLMLIFDLRILVGGALDAMALDIMEREHCASRSQGIAIALNSDHSSSAVTARTRSALAARNFRSVDAPSRSAVGARRDLFEAPRAPLL